MMAVQRYGLDVIWDNHTIPDMEAFKGGLSGVVVKRFYETIFHLQQEV